MALRAGVGNLQPTGQIWSVETFDPARRLGALVVFGRRRLHQQLLSHAATGRKTRCGCLPHATVKSSCAGRVLVPLTQSGSRQPTAEKDCSPLP